MDAVPARRRRPTVSVNLGRLLLAIAASYEFWHDAGDGFCFQCISRFGLGQQTSQMRSRTFRISRDLKEWKVAKAAATYNFDVQDVNLFGKSLEPCTQGDETITGWTRSGSCTWEASDVGFHQVCAKMSKAFLKSSAKYDRNDLSSVVQDGGHWCICAWAWASAVSRDPQTFEGLELDCERTNGHLRDVYQTYAAANRGMASPSGAQYQAQAALDAVEEVCKVK